MILVSLGYWDALAMASVWAIFAWAFERKRSHTGQGSRVLPVLYSSDTQRFGLVGQHGFVIPIPSLPNDVPALAACGTARAPLLSLRC